uniref:Uncharacterized protein n=1 Tax=Fusarium oxysporum (strain Fo5176) TaxID=660025 RepID=A0A0C4DJ87_FUSOF
MSPTRVVSSKIGIVMVAETYSGEDRERQQRRVAPDTSHNQDQGENPLDNSPWAVDNNGDEVRLASSNYTRLKSTDIATNSIHACKSCLWEVITDKNEPYVHRSLCTCVFYNLQGS